MAPAVSYGEVTHVAEVSLPSVTSQRADLVNSHFSGLFYVNLYVIRDPNM